MDDQSERPAHDADEGEGAWERRRDPIDTGITILRWVSGVALAFWLLAVLLTAWATWEATGDEVTSAVEISLQGIPRYPEPGGAGDLTRLRAVALTTVRATSEYLLVFVLSFGLAMMLDLRLRTSRTAPLAPALDVEAEPFDEDADDLDRGPGWIERLARLSIPTTGAKILTWIAIATFGMWAVHFIHTSWTAWDALGDFSTAAGDPIAVLTTAGDSEPITDLMRLRLTFQVAMQTTGAYLMVAVVAFGFALLVRSPSTEVESANVDLS